MKKIVVLVMVVLSVLLSACSTKEGLLKEGEIRIATSPDYAPYEFIDLNKTGNEKYLGSDVELMRYIAKEMGVTLIIEEMTFEATLMAVQSGKVDLAISGFSWTPKRSLNFNMSTGYFGEGDGDQQVLILKENEDKFTNLASLNKSSVKIVAQSGSIQEEFVDVQLPNATKQLVSDLDVALSLLLNKTVDALAISSNAADVRIGNNDNLTVVKENFDVQSHGFVAVAKKGNDKLINEINEIIEKVTSEDLYTKWLDEAKKQAALLGEEIND